MGFSVVRAVGDAVDFVVGKEVAPYVGEVVVKILSASFTGFCVGSCGLVYTGSSMILPENVG